ncbi:12580_t:CDS:2 [Funneliformis caledonium]|uniref:12580_t:CDS:1 n=1 Tax=Funneliformis caledonium TaxID=1117310 RepID=A0A9N8VYD7_9GLOM|nr:12580_t:CDS:2 [Funneliformis caledonium]
MNNDLQKYADGLGYLDKYQLVYMEGLKPNNKDEKVIADASKISKNLQNIFLSMVNDNVKYRIRLPKFLAIFGGGQSFLNRIHLQFIDYCGGGKFHLNEVDNAKLPRDFTEMGDFIFFYECIIKWALLAREVKEAFEEYEQNTEDALSFFFKYFIITLPFTFGIRALDG